MCAKEMTRYVNILITVLILGALTVKGQDNIPTADTITGKLIGTWYLDRQNSKNTLIFSKTSIASRGWGERIEIHKNGDFVDAYGAKCGNDTKIHNNKGKWTFDSTTFIFKTTIPIDYRATTYQVEQVTNDRLIMIEKK